MNLEILSQSCCFDGTQYIVRHDSETIGLPMKFGIYVPDAAKRRPLPVLMYLSGFTGNHETLFAMGQPQRAASQVGLILVSPDTSPRGSGDFENTGKYYVGASASHYIDATESPWRENWRMETYLATELPTLLMQHFPAEPKELGVTGHCMGGHGALLLGLKHAKRFKSVSALSPICSPTKCSWGTKAYARYFGEAATTWAQNDASELLPNTPFLSEVLIDVGEVDEYRSTQLLVDKFVDACVEHASPVRFRVQPGFDHSLYFVQTFIADHIRFHSEMLRG